MLLLLQGLVEVVRCIRCIREGEWPQRLSDVEEMDQIILAQAEARGAEALAADLARGAEITPAPPAEAARRERAGDQQDGR